MAVLEGSMTTKTRENVKKSQKNTKKILLVAQELKLARVLAGNNKTARDRALKHLKKWFQNRSTTMPFNEDDFLRIWKGLFYAMWMSDKPLIQEEYAENIAQLIHFLPLDNALLFYKSGMIVLMNEWFGIDQHRLDKFLMFVRRLLRQVLFVLKNEKWSRPCVKSFTEVLSQTILNTEKAKPLGLQMHFIEIFLEEVSKVSNGSLPPQITTDLIAPFIKELAFTDDLRILNHLRTHIFIYLIRQSDVGLEYQEKYQAWKKLGFPGSINAMQKIDVSNDEMVEEEEEEENEENRILDPRAGRVNVDLAQIKFHPKAIAKALSNVKYAKETNTKTRKCIGELIEHFRKLSSGVYPLGVKKLKLAKSNYDTNVRKAVNRLVKFERKLLSNNKKNKKRRLPPSADENGDEIELRGGKKIKLNKRLHERIAEEMENILKTSEKRKKLKRKSAIIDVSDSNNKKQKVESIFRRNSGMWLVTTKENDQNLFENMEWEKSDDKTEEIEVTLKNTRLSLPSNLIRNPFTGSGKKITPVKKVNFNIQLNRSQDVNEHHAQILNSPAIPYDANKKPAKPLLKIPIVQSPINPFAL